MLRHVRRNESSRRLGKRRFESGWTNAINWPCGPIKASCSAPVENAEDMRELLDGYDFAYLGADLGGGSCAVKVFKDCVKLYHMRLTASHDLALARETADSIISVCTKSYGSQEFLDCDKEKFISMFSEFMLSYNGWEDSHTCEAEKVPAVTLKYPINREQLDEEVLKIIENPKDSELCEEIAYEMIAELAKDGIDLSDDEDDYEDEDDEDEEYESRRRNVIARVRNEQAVDDIKLDSEVANDLYDRVESLYNDGWKLYKSKFGGMNRDTKSYRNLQKIHKLLTELEI